jgi:hypothetical protein
MATNPRSKTPNDAALSAVEEALRLDFGGPGEDSERAPRRPPEPRAPESRSAADAVRRSEMGRRPETSRLPAPPRRLEPPRPSPAREEAPPRRPEPAPAASARPAEEEAAPQPQPARPRAAGTRSRFAANDDRRPAGMMGYTRRPSRMIYPTAMALSLLWAIIVVGVALSTGGLVGPGESFANSPRLLNVALFLFVPIGLIWAIASMMWRTQEMRIVARSITDVAARLSEPENIATDAIANVSQAIRREVAAVGDGIERALARASELELLVHNGWRLSSAPIPTTRRACAR